MKKMVVEIKDRSFSSPIFNPPLSSSNSNHDFNISPNILVIIIILSIIFFISGLLHLLVRFLFRPPNRSPNEIDNLTALEGQLQQLFHLHDCGVDQSFIDTLPLFSYDAVMGVKDPFDCAVCLSEFEPEDKLRLLPKCSHAFHMNCIDTWLLSHSTCPLCRASLFGDFPQNGLNSPLVRILESGSEREMVLERESESGISSSDDEEDVCVKLGKYTKSFNGEIMSSELARRCFSMGSFAYVMNEDSSLKVAMKKNQSCKKRMAMSECGCDSRRGFEALNVVEIQNENKSIVKRESFSVSKIWLKGRKDEGNAGSFRRAFSFRFPGAAGESNCGGGGRSSLPEIENNLDCEGDQYPSFGRRSLVWLMGTQNKVAHSSFPTNV